MRARSTTALTLLLLGSGCSESGADRAPTSTVKGDTARGGHAAPTPTPTPTPGSGGAEAPKRTPAGRGDASSSGRPPLYRDRSLAVLKEGEKTELGGMTVEHVKVDSDSRCPRGVQCITAGNAEVRIRVDGATHRLSVPGGEGWVLPGAGNAENVVARNEGHLVFARLEPYPEAPTPGRQSANDEPVNRATLVLLQPPAGTATLRNDGTLVLDPGARQALADLGDLPATLEPRDPRQRKVLGRLGGLRRGQSKPVYAAR